MDEIMPVCLRSVFMCMRPFRWTEDRWGEVDICPYKSKVDRRMHEFDADRQGMSDLGVCAQVVAGSQRYAETHLSLKVTEHMIR